FTQKWWDYKPIHPLHATYEFAEAYIESYVRATKKRYGDKEGQHVKPLRFRNFLKCEPAVVTGMWRARQFADRIGCTYEFYCEKAMKFASACDWKYLPRPHLMYSTTTVGDLPSMLEYIEAQWQENRKTQFMIAKSDFYKNENFRGNIYQIKHQQALMRFLEGYSGNRAYIATAWVFDQRILLPDLVKIRLGSEFYNEISRLAAGT
ncbi:MAG TPA: hypothetical protein PKY22_13290, partial [Accumulibacter sp.]|nr:hypothetical protein [Accumulibacter sp.]